jgi:hypothetical protein
MGKDRFVRKKASRMNYRELRKGELQRISLLIVYARSGDVAGGQLLQVLVGASLSWRGAHPGNGSRAYRSSLVDGGVVDAFAVPPAEVPRWRGRKPKWLLEAEDAA